MPSVPPSAMTHTPPSTLPTRIGEALERRLASKSALPNTLFKRGNKSKSHSEFAVQVPTMPSATFDFPIAVRTPPPPRLG